MLESTVERGRARIHDVRVADGRAADLVEPLGGGRGAAVLFLHWFDVGTASASLVRAQAELVRAVLQTGWPTVTVALRTPWDLASYPAAGTHLRTYGLGETVLDARAAVCFGELPARGRLPVAA